VRADRLVAIVLLLQGRGTTSAPELARELEVSTRTVYRDVEALGSAGIPVYAERGAQGGIRLVDGYRTDLTGMSAQEAESLLVMGIPGPLDQLGIGASADAARRKVLAALPASGRSAAEAVRQRIYVDPRSWAPPRPLPHLAAIADAVWTGRRLELEYVRADNAEVTRRVHPLGVVLKAGVWYLVARMGEWEVTFRVERVRAVRILDRPAVRPPQFDLVRYWDAQVDELTAGARRYRVRLAVERDSTARLARLVGEDVRDQVIGSGGDRPVLDVGFASLDDAVSAVLALGTSAEVVAPDELRGRLGGIADALAARYGSDRMETGCRP
jgi:predicted DNA-binding transcriptional regulator YafY